MRSPKGGEDESRDPTGCAVVSIRTPGESIQAVPKNGGIPMPTEELALYLAPWQKRILKDFAPASYFKSKPIREISRIIVRKGTVKCPQSYKIPAGGIRRGDWVLHLTDEQMIMVRDHFGTRTPITSLNVGPDSLQSGDIQFR
jgi:hypothetical protein